jgi:fermentation-respiration switch protein FrsA (DUF1100 family)
MKKLSVFIAAFMVILGQTYGQIKQKTQTNKSEAMKQTEQTDHYTFQLSDKVTRQKVTFKNRYGITLAGDLYLPKSGGNKTLAALAISGPYGAVRQQSSGLYAQNMAEHGIATLAFDPSYTGESGGEPRNISSPDINTEDFSAAVDYLGLQSFIDSSRIGVIGICGFGGFSLSATAVDKRIKAVATTSMYDMCRVMAKGMYDSQTEEQRNEMLSQMSQQRWIDAKNGIPAPGPRNLPVALDSNSNPIIQEYFDYYRTPRGFHKNSLNSNGAWTITNAIPFMNFPLLTYIKEISPRPVLIIAGEKAFSRYFAEDAYKAAAEPKELYIVPGAGHVDLYDRVNIIPFDKLVDFFNKNLK